MGCAVDLVRMLGDELGGVFVGVLGVCVLCIWSIRGSLGRSWGRLSWIGGNHLPQPTLIAKGIVIMGRGYDCAFRSLWHGTERTQIRFMLHRAARVDRIEPIPKGRGIESVKGFCFGHWPEQGTLMWTQRHCLTQGLAIDR